jgi:murein DD-endopeptidase MepM/ murein hydrolase activator NlpD
MLREGFHRIRGNALMALSFIRRSFPVGLGLFLVGALGLPGLPPTQQERAAHAGVAQAGQEVAQSWYLLPYPARGQGWQTIVMLTNLGSRELRVNFAAYDEDGEFLGASTIRLAAQATRTLETGEVLPESGTLKVEAKEHLWVGAIFRTRDGTKAEVLPALDDPSRQLDFPALLPGDLSSKTITLLNPDAASASLELIALDQTGAELSRTLLPPLSPMASHTFAVRDLFSGDILQQLSTVRVISDRGIVGLQLVEPPDGDLVGLPALTVTSREWSFPIATRSEAGELWTAVGLFNPGEVATSVTVEAFDEANNSLGVIESLTLLPGATHFVLTANRQGSIPLNAAFLKVTSDQAIAGYEVIGIVNGTGLTAALGIPGEDQTTAGLEITGSNDGGALSAYRIVRTGDGGVGSTAGSLGSREWRGRLLASQNKSTVPTTTITTADTTPPTNVLVTTPTSGQTISGTFTLKGTAQDNLGIIQKMEFYIDSDTSPACSDTTPKASGSTFECNWYSHTKRNGVHTVKAKAYDPSGNWTFSPPVAFTIRAGTFKLSFPLQGYTPYNAPISSVFDHSINEQVVDVIPRGLEYNYDGVVIAYTGERGEGQPAKYTCYQQQGGFKFTLHGNYRGGSSGPSFLCYDGHPGYDYPVNIGTPVYAAADGEVIEAGTDKTKAIYVKIKHLDGGYGGNEFHTLYYHLSEIERGVGAGKAVKAGDPIGKSGCTGEKCTGPHLHFEVIKVTPTGQVSVDPYGWEGVGILWDLPATSCRDGYEPNDSFSRATQIALGSTSTGKICSSADGDYFKFNVASAGTISLSLTVPSSNDYELELFDASFVKRAGSYNGPGQSESITFQANASSTYYIRVYGDKGSYSTTASYTLTCGSGSAPDLVVTALSDPPSTIAQGGNFTVSDTTKNIGTGVAGFSTTRYRLSRDNIITSADPLLTGSRSVPSLSPNEESTGSVTVTVPTTIPPGTYYLGACADDLKAVSEANEANNCRASTTRVQVMRVAGRTFDYTLSNSGNITVTQGGSGSTTITRTLVSGTPQPVSLRASGLPPGATPRFTNNPCTPTCSSTLTISTSASTPTGTFPITVTGSPGGKTTSFNLIVTAPRPYTLTVYKQGRGSGTVTATGCTLTWSGNTGTCTAASGTPITLRAQADAGSIFSGWEGIIGSASGCSGTGPCTFTLTENSSVAAVFTSITDTTFLHFYDVTYGNGRFVAVGDWGMSVTSPDGVTWTVRASGVPRALRGVTYGNGRFVAVGDGVILTSPDGVTWTKRGSGTYVLYGVTYGNGRFVAVGGNGVILTSPDGVTWTVGASGTDDLLLAVTYGNGLFVAVGIRIGDRDGPGIAGAILTSADGVTWTVRPSWRGNYLQGVNYVNGLFIAVGGFSYGLSPILTSADGVTWTLRWHDRPSPLHDVTYGNGRFVAVGDWGMSVTSADGVTWRMEGFSGIHGHGVTYGNGLFVAVGSTTVESAGAIVTSSDGVTWTRRPLGTTP